MLLLALSSCSDDQSVSSNEDSTKSFAKTLVCPEGTHAAYVYNFNTIKLHRAKTGCTSRFSICADGKWEWECVPDDGAVPVYGPADDGLSNTAKVAAEVSKDLKNIKFRFPIELLTDPSFVPSDFTTFGFDTDYTVGDYIVKTGDYQPIYTSTEIQVIVDLR